MNPPSPHITEPTGAPKPFDRQKHTLSASRTNSATEQPQATAALKIRAPSTCTRRPCACAVSANSRIRSGGSAAPPQKLCVFSSASSDVRG